MGNDKRMRRVRRFLSFLVLVCLTGAVAYGFTERFSRQWRDLVEEQCAQRGIYLTLESLALSPLEGPVASGIKVYHDPQHQDLLGEIDRLNLDLDYSKMLRKELFLEGLDLRDADVLLPIDPQDPKSESLALSDINARIYLVGDRIELRRAEGTMFGLHVSVTGSLLRPPTPPGPRDPEAERDLRRKRLAAIHAKRNLIIEAARILKHFESATAPRLDLEVSGNLANLDGLNVNMHLRANGLTHGTYVCEEVEVMASYAGETVDLERLYVKDHLGEMEANATWRLGGEQVDFQIRSSADLPKLAEAVYQNEGLRELVFYDPIELEAQGKILLGKAVPAGALLPVQCVGSLRTGRFTTRGKVLESAEMNFGLSPMGWYVRDGILRHKSGTLGLQAMYRTDTGIRYRALVQMDPNVFEPFVQHPITRDIIRRFEIREGSGIYGELEGSGPSGDLRECVTRGKANVHNFKYRGMEISHVTADVEFSRGKQIFRNARLERADGVATVQEVICDNPAKTIKLTQVESDVDPVALVNCFAPKIAEVVARYRFDRHPRVHMTGIIFLGQPATDLKVQFRSLGSAHYILLGKDYTIYEPYGDLHFMGRALDFNVVGINEGQGIHCRGKTSLAPEQRDFDAVFLADGFSYNIFGKDVPFQALRADIVSKEGLMSYNLKSRLFEGGMTVSGKVDNRQEPPAYEGEARVNAVAFQKFAQVYSPKNHTDGDVTGHMKFAGRLGDWKTLNGGGALAILNGNLYAVPILGPLTPLLGSVLPRPLKGYNEAKEADCTFKVADGFLTTDDVEALTGVFRLQAKGSVDFLENRIQFEAKAKVRGLPGLVLFPVSEILEYIGEGSVGNPLWRPRYFSASKERTPFRQQGEEPDAPPAAQPEGKRPTGREETDDTKKKGDNKFRLPFGLSKEPQTKPESDSENPAAKQPSGKPPRIGGGR